MTTAKRGTLDKILRSARLGWSRAMLCLRCLARHGRYTRLPENEYRAVTTMALAPPSLWFQSGTAWQSFPMLDEGLWAEIKVGGEHLRLFHQL